MNHAAAWSDVRVALITHRTGRVCPHLEGIGNAFARGQGRDLQNGDLGGNGNAVLPCKAGI